MYEYTGKVIAVVDGDTLDIQFDLGFDTYRNERIRLYGIDTPETRTKNADEKKAGLAAKARVKELVAGKTIRIQTIKDETEKYGRYLGKVVFDDNSTLNDLLIKEGLAKPYFGEKKDPFKP